jgi:glycosyltransferase involved in cell wall biosynthesis
MKVLMVFPEFPSTYRTGVVSVLYYLTKALKKKCEIKIITFSHDRVSKERIDKNDDEILVYAQKINLYSLYRLASEVKKEASKGYDVVHGQTGTSVLYKTIGSNVPACITNHGIGYKVYHFYWKYKVTRSRSDFLPYLKYFPRKISDPLMARILFSFADRVTTVSSFTRYEISKIYGVPEEKIDVVPNGVPTDLFTPEIPEEQKADIRKRYNFDEALLCLPPVPRKGLHIMIKALPAIVKEFPHLKLLVVGAISTSDTYYKFCYALSKKLGVHEKVVFVGWVDDVNLPKYYSVASAYVLPTLYEALPLTILESMACGTPVCASKCGGIPEIITHGEDGLLFDPKNTDTIAQILISLLSDRSLQKRLAYNARKKIEQQYSWERIAEKYIAIYKKILQK